MARIAPRSAGTRVARLFPRLVPRLVVVVVGIAGIALGIVCIVRARFGADPLTVFLQGLARTSGLTLGQATQLSFVVLLGVNYLVGRERPGVATVASVALEGPLIDALEGWLPPLPAHSAVRAALLGAGTLSLAFGIALYVTPRLGAGPPEGLMFAVQRRFALALGRAKILVDGLALAAGWALRGDVGAGTLLLVVAVGPLVHLFYHWLRAALPTVAGPDPAPFGIR